MYVYIYLYVYISSPTPVTELTRVEVIASIAFAERLPKIENRVLVTRVFLPVIRVSSHTYDHCHQVKS